MTKAQALLNDPQGVLWIQAAPIAGSGQVSLIPFLNMAYEDLLRKLRNNGVELRVTVPIDLPLASGLTPTVLSDVSNPQLPPDCVVPLKLWEQPTDSGQLFVPMRKVDQLPNLAPSAFLILWQWQDDQINLIGATQATTIQIEYGMAKAAIQAAADPILIPFSSNTLARGCAAYASSANSGAAAPNVKERLAEFEASLEALVLEYVNPEQRKSRRRRPYGYRRRLIYL